MINSFFIISDELHRTLEKLPQIKDRYIIYDYILSKYFNLKIETSRVPGYLVIYRNYAWRCVQSIKYCSSEKYQEASTLFYDTMLAPLSRNERNNLLDKARQVIFKGINPSELKFASKGLETLFIDILDTFIDDALTREKISKQCRASVNARWSRSRTITGVLPSKSNIYFYDLNTKKYAFNTILYDPIRKYTQKIPPKEIPPDPYRNTPLKNIIQRIIYNTLKPRLISRAEMISRYFPKKKKGAK